MRSGELANACGASEQEAPLLSPAGTGLLRSEHAVHEELERARRRAARVDDLPARLRVDLEPVVGRLRTEHLDSRRETAHLHAAGVAVDVDRVVAVRAVDDDAVGRAVSAAGAAREVD